MAGADDQAGQASVELVAALPLVLLAALIAFQLLVVGYAFSVADGASQAGALAAAGGGSAKQAAREALPDWAHDPEVSTERGRVDVSFDAPAPFGIFAGDSRVDSSAWVREPRP